MTVRPKNFNGVLPVAIQLAEIIDRISIAVPLDVPQLMQCQDHLREEIKAKNAKPKQAEGGWRRKAAGVA